MSVTGVVLAGGAGRRIGGDKARHEVRGVPMLLHPLRALQAVTAEQAVVAKPDTRLPPLPPGVGVWREPVAPRHPLTGILEALRRAGGGDVLCCAVDLVALDAATLGRLLEAASGPASCVVPRAAGRLEPLCALWRPAAAAVLAALPQGVAMRDAVAACDAHEVAFAAGGAFVNVNYPNVNA